LIAKKIYYSIGGKLRLFALLSTFRVKGAVNVEIQKVVWGGAALFLGRGRGFGGGGWGGGEAGA
jgi:hypothetical protein